VDFAPEIAMSVVNQSGMKILLPARGPNVFWTAVFEHYAGEDAETWRRLAMFVLKETGGWTQDRIGHVFGIDRGTVCRALQRVRGELRERFDCEPEECPVEEDASDDPVEMVRTASASLWTSPRESRRTCGAGCE
jgi:hypothetical protein